MDVIVSRTINASQPTVATYMSDLRNDVAWRKNITEAELVSGTPGEVGVKFSQTMLAMGQPTKIMTTLTSVDDGRYAYLGEGGPMPVTLFVGCVPGAGDTTDVSLSFTLELPPAMAKMAEKMITAEMTNDLATLAGILETS
jgi:hypothetical protein